MSNLFYSKLALTNLKKNSSVYIPYITTCICSVVMFYIMHSLSINEGLTDLPSADMIKMVMELGAVVIGFFSVIFLFYTNSFLMKRRKRELGLYNILGMEKKHMAKMLFLETLFVAAAGLIAGLAAGVLLSRMMFLVLLKILRFPVPMAFSVSWESLLVTAALFSVIFLATLLFNLCQIHLTAPIELLRSGNKGEKEPKGRWILAVLGMLALGAGYVIALTCEAPMAAIMMFFPAVILVMIGTYLLFTTGSIAALKMMKKNRNFYYSPKHFTVVSGMMYRMKQNAAGLANICILSTMVLVILSTTVSMYIGMEDSIATRYPMDTTLVLHSDTPENRQTVQSRIASCAKENGLTVVKQNEGAFFSLPAVRQGAAFLTDDIIYGLSDVSTLNFMTQDEYNRAEANSISLAADEALVYSPTGDYGTDTLTLRGETFHVKELSGLELAETNDNRMLSSNYYIVVRDEGIIEALRKEKEGDWQVWRVNLTLSGDDDYAKAAFAESVRKGLPDWTEVISQQQLREMFLSLNGGFLFLGLFLGTLFLMATVLIIYYKQISEGYDDKERFAIMKKVGMSSAEVRSSIRSQILMVFFLPLAAAVLHITFAFYMFSEILEVFSLYDKGLFLACTGATILVFAVLYAVVYSLTARTYYRIVNYEMDR